MLKGGEVMGIQDEKSVYMDEHVFERVPLKDRQSWVSFMVMFMGIWSAIGALSVGIDVGPQLTPWKSSLALFLGYMITMMYGILVGNVGRREGLSTAVLCQRPFSKYGKIIPAFLIFIIGLVFIGVQADAIARIVLQMVGVKFSGGFSWVRGIVAASLCSIMMYSSYRGIKNMTLVSWITIPIFYLVLIVSLILTLNSYPGGLASLLVLPENKISFSAVVFLGVSTYSGFSAYMSDVSRFLRTKGDLAKALIIGYIVATFVPIWGVLVGASLGTTEYWKVFSQFGVAFAIFSAIGLFLAQWSINDHNAFSSGLAMSTIFTTLHNKYSKVPRLTRKQATLFPIIVGIVLSFVGPGSVNLVLIFVRSLGSWTVPMAGVLIAHYYILEKIGNPVETRGLSGILAMGVTGVLTQLGIMPLPAVTSLVLSIVLYLLTYYAVERPFFGDVALPNIEQEA